MPHYQVVARKPLQLNGESNLHLEALAPAVGSPKRLNSQGIGWLSKQTFPCQHTTNSSLNFYST
jgi:hypothetical protein